MNEENLIEKARDFATKKHMGQLRKDGPQYITHPISVAKIVEEYWTGQNAEALITAALLHDTVEDTDTTIEEIKKEFGKYVAGLVAQLTVNEEEMELVGKVKYHSEKMIDTKEMSNEALFIRLADRLDNMASLKNLKWKKFVEKYVDATRMILENVQSGRELKDYHRILIKKIEEELGGLG